MQDVAQIYAAMRALSPEKRAELENKLRDEGGDVTVAERAQVKHEIVKTVAPEVTADVIANMTREERAALHCELIAREIELDECIEDEPLVQEGNEFVMMEGYEVADEFTRRHISTHWALADIVVSEDTNSWAALDPRIKRMVKIVLSFFSSADGIVIEQLFKNFIRQTRPLNLKAYYNVQMASETVHAATYALFIRFYSDGPEDQKTMEEAMHNLESVKRKASFCLNYINNPKTTYAKRMLAFAALERISFVGAFLIIYWVTKDGALQALAHSNQLIARDENLHGNAGVAFYNSYIKNQVPDAEVYEMVDELVQADIMFNHDMIDSDGFPGLTREIADANLKYEANLFLTDLGLKPVYEGAEQAELMKSIQLQTDTNGFERQRDEYRKGGVAKVVGAPLIAREISASPGNNPINRPPTVLTGNLMEGPDVLGAPLYPEVRGL